MALRTQEVTSCSPRAECCLEKGRAENKAGGSSRGLGSMWNCVSLSERSKTDRDVQTATSRSRLISHTSSDDMAFCNCARKYTIFQSSTDLSISGGCIHSILLIVIALIFPLPLYLLYSQFAPSEIGTSHERSA